MTDDPDTSLLGRTPGLDEEHFVHDGLITKHPVRAMALAVLRPLPGQLLWDLGTGAGSVAVEWCRTDPSCRAIGVERRADRAANARANASALTLPGQFEVIDADLAEGLPEMPAPDAVFIGGGATRELAEACRQVLAPGGRFVIHGVTIEAESLLAELHAQWGGELMRVGVETADHIGRLHGWKPARTVIGWSWTK
ncbi:precorrin-6Y C5,15-methyltransferase (decarboxylating) subunit CbiT [Acidipropionibacterium jensenii]|uniref:precorrin-6Y C5,15-methyltransferase (decarboxylating) subunit CbiT n=1 Tax=Acidipropionibacterium jensenii TaxID=1749 RepID=UPI000BC2FDDB|nr:precorrin-6Y C5,15-methyltransferase (decarboxylating) subunit CbiT [Acidipropionibacterium jensenii]AZZ40997.1 precorrin-6Y C5,15-methyltransferase (decarboxylating) subunit CbiT [Acidipropionibacterium jensenii]